MISLIVAHDIDRVIGKENDLPWRIPEDLAYFKKMTMGKPMIMGRKTFDSIGKPLPGRQSIVVTRNKNYAQEGVIVTHTLKEAIEVAKQYADEVMIIGGAEIFSLGLGIANRLYVTFINKHFEGDVYFPMYGTEWKLASTSEEQQSTSGTPFSYLVYEKK